MRLNVQITRYADGRRSFLVFEDTAHMNEGILGRGWTLPDAIDEFIEEYNRWTFADDDNPAPITREQVSLRRPVTIYMKDRAIS